MLKLMIQRCGWGFNGSKMTVWPIDISLSRGSSWFCSTVNPGWYSDFLIPASQSLLVGKSSCQSESRHLVQVHHQHTAQWWDVHTLPDSASYHKKPWSRGPWQRHVRLVIRGHNMGLWALNIARGAKRLPEESASEAVTWKGRRLQRRLQELLEGE